MRKKPGLFNRREDGCYVCGNPYVEEHHIIFGTGRRKISDDDGCVVYLCNRHHQDPRVGIHFDKEFDLRMKQECQRRWERREGIEEPDHETFTKRFYRNYL